ncbi:MAG: protein-disulfide reductase DsbD family protein [Sediminibacterium sp.]|nr:protein-disulfide reductase DsbD family protein [Sediminibacterium sp.]
MKSRFLLFYVCLLFSWTTKAQMQTNNPVRWHAVYVPVSGVEGEVQITAEIEKNWHTYSQRPTDAGPIPTSFAYTPDKSYSLEGKTIESDAHEEYVKAFEAKILVFTDKAVFKQKIKRTNNQPFKLSAKVEYMACNDVMCLPPKTEILEIQVK